MSRTEAADYNAPSSSVEGAHMPEVSRFLGITIYLYYADHAPPHFHAEYGEFEITVDIEARQKLPLNPIAPLE